MFASTKLTSEELSVLVTQTRGLLDEEQIRILAEEFFEETGGTFYSGDHIRETIRGMGFATDFFADLYMRLFDKNPPGVQYEGHSDEITLEKWIYANAHITSTRPTVRAEVLFNMFNVRDRRDDPSAWLHECLAYEKNEPLPPMNKKHRAYIEVDDVARVLEEFLVLFKKDDRFRDRLYVELRREVANARGIAPDDEEAQAKLTDFCLMHELAKRMWRSCGKDITEPLYITDFLVLQRQAPSDFPVLEFFYDSLREVFHS